MGGEELDVAERGVQRRSPSRRLRVGFYAPSSARRAIAMAVRTLVAVRAVGLVLAGLGAGPLAAEPLVAGDFIFNGGFEASTFISTVQQDEVGYGGKSVIIDNVRVTAVKSTSGAYTLFLQDSMSSPQYSAIRVFVSGADAPTFNDLALTAIGDCVSITGTVGEFMGATELAPVTGFGGAFQRTGDATRSVLFENVRFQIERVAAARHLPGPPSLARSPRPRRSSGER